MPGERSKTHEPQYAPAEALERDEDYDGALREYMVIARIFPKDPTALLRIVNRHGFGQFTRITGASGFANRRLTVNPFEERHGKILQAFAEQASIAIS
ncbi:MAG: hypothetical protein HGA24_04550, partial [Candidatus Aminicenantes bacterium]|nr:hypothetical protein [Candidatus Aminicenantes bacterium]